VSHLDDNFAANEELFNRCTVGKGIPYRMQLQAQLVAALFSIVEPEDFSRVLLTLVEHERSEM